MGKITIEFTTKYDVGNIVAFEKNNAIMIGVIAGYYVEDNIIWYNIQINKDYTFTWNHGGDINEGDILFKLTHEQVDKMKAYVKNNDWEIKDR